MYYFNTGDQFANGEDAQFVGRKRKENKVTAYFNTFSLFEKTFYVYYKYSVGRQVLSSEMELRYHVTGNGIKIQICVLLFAI